MVSVRRVCTSVGKDFNLFLKWQNKIKEMWIKGISKVLPEDKIGFFESVLLGEKRNLDSSQKILFQIMGCSHILAKKCTSGYICV